jgi:alanine dehydrogenase
MTIFLNNEDIQSLLDPPMVISALEKSYLDLAEGNAVCRVASNLQLPTDRQNETYQWGTTDGGTSAGYLAIRMTSDVRYETEVQGKKQQDKYCVSKGTYCGLVFLFRVNNGEPLAIMNDGYMQQQRVGADSAIGVKYMASKDAEVIGMFGAGGMARSNVEAIREVRKIKKIQVFDPLAASAKTYAEEIRSRFGIEVVILNDPLAIYKGAEILAECTNAGGSVIEGDLIESGTHVVSIGRRLDNATFDRIDRSLRLGNATPPKGHASVTDEHLSYVAPSLKKSGGKGGHSTGFETEIAKEKVVTLADVKKSGSGRPSKEAITYSERGNIMGAQFHALAGVIYDKAVGKGVGKSIPTEWFLQSIRN